LIYCLKELKLVKYWHIGDKEDFFTSRSCRLGASDISALIPSPENPVESLAGYGRTALTVYQEKIGEIEREPAGLAAEMGHFLENKALELFIRRFSGKEEGNHFRGNKESWENFYSKNQEEHELTIHDFQTKLYKHNTQYYTEGMIAHPDCIYIGDETLKGKKGRLVTVDGVKVDLSKPFLIEAKSARKFAAKRPEGSMVKGYDLNLSSWHGIPLKHYMQIQFQLALFQIPVGYLALIHDTSDFQVWRIDADKRTQGQIMDIVGKMVQHIKNKTFPRELSMNANDVKIMIPEIQRDFVNVQPETEKGIKALEIQEAYNKAKEQEEIWKARKQDASDAAAVMLGEFEELRVGNEKVLNWTFKKGSETFKKIDPKSKEGIIKQLKKSDPVSYNYMKKKGYIYETKPTRYVAVSKRRDEE
jgi:hypothetical protein